MFSAEAAKEQDCLWDSLQLCTCVWVSEVWFHHDYGQPIKSHDVTTNQPDHIDY